MSKIIDALLPRRRTAAPVSSVTVDGWFLKFAEQNEKLAPLHPLLASFSVARVCDSALTEWNSGANLLVAMLHERGEHTEPALKLLRHFNGTVGDLLATVVEFKALARKQIGTDISDVPGAVHDDARRGLRALLMDDDARSLSSWIVALVHACDLVRGLVEREPLAPVGQSRGDRGQAIDELLPKLQAALKTMYRAIGPNVTSHARSIVTSIEPVVDLVRLVFVSRLIGRDWNSVQMDAAAYAAIHAKVHSQHQELPHWREDMQLLATAAAAIETIATRHLRSSMADLCHNPSGTSFGSTQPLPTDASKPSRQSRQRASYDALARAIDDARQCFDVERVLTCAVHETLLARYDAALLAQYNSFERNGTVFFNSPYDKKRYFFDTIEAADRLHELLKHVESIVRQHIADCEALLAPGTPLTSARGSHSAGDVSGQRKPKWNPFKIAGRATRSAESVVDGGRTYIT